MMLNLDFAKIAALLKGGADLPSAAKALGMEVRNLQPIQMPDSFCSLARGAQIGGAEVLELIGEMKGRKVRIIAVISAPEGSGQPAIDAPKKVLAK